MTLFWDGGKCRSLELEMSPFLLLLNVSKLVGVAGVLSVAVNSVVYRQFRRRNFGEFRITIDDTEDVLASFPVDKDGSGAHGAFRCCCSGEFGVCLLAVVSSCKRASV